MNNSNQIKVWDLPVRLFHWTLASAFFIAYLTEDEWLDIHTFAGYTVAALVVFRLLWGFIGSRHARFSDFVRPPRETFAYLKDVVSLRPKRYIGHNPAGGAMVVALLLSLLLTVITGLSVYGSEEMAGPLAGLFTNTPEYVAEAFEELHEFFANVTLLLVVLHVVGVIIAGIQHGENLIRAMFSGKKQAV
ncbi:cytochrome b/b6 domain-containing protein [Sulfuriflexus mobilis]|uniref:cytochrome b/b6 domain-containing protein n=1 Tax=Sulfuriflexus mobilis TaxID=1811807 RepID=UPI000F82B307|nr:cytochrome b/b6 domain-containing protein [Sulfuriflexus mobilis]